MNEDFIQNYIDSCRQEGKTSLQAIGEKAKEEISKIDLELKVVEQLRLKQNALKNMLKQLGLEPKKIKTISTVLNNSSNFSDLDPLIQDMCGKICKYMENITVPITNRQIMTEVSSLEENKIVLLAIKWLWEQGIITKDEHTLTREIIKGPNWDKRPQ